MWKDYSAGFIKNNRASSLSIRIAAFISALLLALLCGVFYNAWKYEVERVKGVTGGWQSRIMGEFNRETIEAVKNFATVEDAVVNEKESKGAETAVDIYFYDYGTVFTDTPRIAELAGISPKRVVYNYELLAMYLIRDEGDTAPRLLFPMFLAITVMASFSLIVIIYNSFAVSMNARIHQFGIFSSIGAAPKQIRTCLLQEAAALCTVPVLTGNVLGIAGSMGLIQLSNLWAGGVEGRQKASPGYHPLVLLVTLLITAAVIWISAWLPARKLSRLTPLEAIRNTGELQLSPRAQLFARYFGVRGYIPRKTWQMKPFVLKLLFGVEGELAGNALKAQKKAMRTASLSLVLSLLAFTIMQCFVTTSQISTRETYFERYQDVWDIMAAVQDAEVDSFEKLKAIQGLDGVKSAVVYQKAYAKRVVKEEEMSEEMKSFGGFSHDSGKYTVKGNGGWLVSAPVVILDDDSFLTYCEQAGIPPRLDGAVIYNQIRDVTNPDFRHPHFMRYIKEENTVTVLRQSGNEKMTAEIPVLSYTAKAPVLREEYASVDYYELVHFIPVSLWKEIKGQIGGLEEEVFIRVLGRENVTVEELNTLQRQIDQLVSPDYSIESENRIQEYKTNKQMIQGIRVIFGSFCVLLAVIGIGDVFSNTLGFVRQRKREFARYLSVGMTPGEAGKVFCIEALAIAARPVLTTLPFAVIAVCYMLKLSYLGVEEFLAEMPFFSIAAFMLSVICAVALAYYCGWRNLRNISLAEVLRDDTMI